MTRRYDIMIVMDDFKVGSNEANMQHFLNLCNLKNLITEKSCFENRENPSYNDLINCSKRFQDSDTHETRLPGFNQMTVSVLKMHFPKQKSSFILYCDYKSVSNKTFTATCGMSYQNMIFIIRNASTFRLLLQRFKENKKI